jgi:nitroimidazol reductase NimA-like FMN-containing flavoprotein (pyridoxamine 5'-phosphate oxidase superfamily)
VAEPLSEDEILAEACRIAQTQLGGTLATMHSEDGTPYVTFVLFHLRPDGQVLFGSNPAPQHARNMAATPEVSFLIDNREVVRNDWTEFDRVVIEGRAEVVEAHDGRYQGMIEELREKNRMAAFFTEHGFLYTVVPRRLILMKGFEPTRNVVDFR